MINTNKKSLFKLLIIGAKQGWNTPTLPANIIKIDNNPLILLLKMLSTVSLLCVVCNNYLQLSLNSLYLALFFMTIY